jgi:CheY-like chemotaxis protein
MEQKDGHVSAPTFVYVENDPLSREVMKTMFTRGLGYPVITLFENSADFVDKLAALAQKPDVIFLDIHMEPLDGFALLEVIRQNEHYRSTQVVALTASVMNEEVKKLREAGFDGVIAKPINYDIFPSVLERILKGEEVWNVK